MKSTHNLKSVFCTTHVVRNCKDRIDAEAMTYLCTGDKLEPNRVVVAQNHSDSERNASE